MGVQLKIFDILRTSQPTKDFHRGTEQYEQRQERGYGFILFFFIQHVLLRHRLHMTNSFANKPEQ